MNPRASESILAFVPAYNESAAIARVVSHAAEYLPVLVVDDGSSDDTVAQAESAGATVIRQPTNLGKGKALRRGFTYALDEGYDAVITLDGDGQHDPAEIPAFLACRARTQADLIIGYRDFALMPSIRRLSNTVGTSLFSWAMGTPIRDNQSGYRLVSRALMAATLAGHEAGFEFEMEMIVTCVESSLKLDWVPIRTIYAGEASHIRPFQHAVNFVRVAVQSRRRLHRARRETYDPPSP